MTPHFTATGATLYHGDCLDVLRELPDASVDAVVTDPPYGISFMGKQWDQPGEFGSASRRGGGPNKQRGEWDAALEAGRYDLSSHAMHNFQRWCEQWATECLRVLKPGGHLLAFGGSRTWHRLTTGIEDAGFEIRDSIAWLYGSGFPKSLDVSKAIDKATGAEREKVPATGGLHKNANLNDDGWHKIGATTPLMDGSTPASDDARRWQGWGTALKPAFEPIVVARKPLTGTVAANVLTHGTGALNIDGCRINPGDGVVGGGGWAAHKVEATEGWDRPYANGVERTEAHTKGRWPANVILDDTQAAELDQQSGQLVSGKMRAGTRPIGERTTFGADVAAGYETTRDTPGDSGGASRFFVRAGWDEDDLDLAARFYYTAKAPGSERVRLDGIAHPTVKPLALMRWLVKLVTPPGGTVLEPFAGSGTTVEACLLEGLECIAIEREADYLPLIVQRINHRRDVVAAVRAAGIDGGIFDLFGEEGT